MSLFIILGVIELLCLVELILLRLSRSKGPTCIMARDLNKVAVISVNVHGGSD